MVEQGWGAPYATILGNRLKPFKCLICEPKVYHLPKCAEVIHFYCISWLLLLPNTALNQISANLTNHPSIQPKHGVHCALFSLRKQKSDIQPKFTRWSGNIWPCDIFIFMFWVKWNFLRCFRLWALTTTFLMLLYWILTRHLQLP